MIATLLVLFFLIVAEGRSNSNDMNELQEQDTPFDNLRRILLKPWNSHNPSNNGGINPFIPSTTYNPAPPPHVLIGPDYQLQILTQRYIRPNANSTNDDAYMAAPTDDNTDPRYLALNGIILSVSGFIIFMIIVSVIVSRIKSKALQIEQEKGYDEEMFEIGEQMVSIGTQCDDHVPLIPVAYSDTPNTGFQLTDKSALAISSKLPPIRKKLKVRKSADGSIKSAFAMEVPLKDSAYKAKKNQEVSPWAITIKEG